MDRKRTIASGVIGIVAISGGVDASILNEKPIALTEIHLKEEVVTLEQKGNIIDAQMPWKDQVGIKVKYDLGEPTVAERFVDKRAKQVITETVDIGDGGFKIDVLLNEKPDTNTFCYTIEGAENYDFFYQPALTAQEIAEGSSRPEEIVGSYAVYHKTLANHRVGGENYATGKVMHIPFPYVWEMNNATDTRQRAENMTYADGQLCVLVGQDFLDKATYPVRVDPTFGYTTLGATTGSDGPDRVRLRIGSVASAGTLDSVTMGVAKTVGYTGVGVAGAVYDSSLNLLDSSGNLTTTGIPNTTPSWVTRNLTSQTISTSTAYASYAGDTVTAITDAIYFATDSGGVSGESKFASPASIANPYSFPDPFTGTNSATIYSIYATYTAGGGSTEQQTVILFE